MSASTLSLVGAAPLIRPALYEAIALLPSEEFAGWRVWRRKKGAGYWLMRWATKVSRLFDTEVTNPNGLEDCGTVRTLEEAEDLCRIIYQECEGSWAVTYEPVMVGRVHALRTELAKGDRRFDPFRVFDFSATEAVLEQARYALVDLTTLREIEEKLVRMTAAVRGAL